MKNIFSVALLFVLAHLSLGEEVAGPADTVFFNGNIHTVNDAQPQAEAIAIKGDRILFVGSNEDAKKYSGSATRTLDLKGKAVVPGLTDSHYHILGVGERLTRP